jgi:3'(2'), 5'-bisphosphate nucleotidase
VIGSRSHGADELNAWLQKLPCPHDFVAAGSSLKFCRIAEGGAHAYPRFGPTSQWDTAAAHCVLNQAGGVVLALDGKPLRYGVSRPILNSYFLACHAANAGSLLAHS